MEQGTPSFDRAPKPKGPKSFVSANIRASRRVAGQESKSHSRSTGLRRRSAAGGAGTPMARLGTEKSTLAEEATFFYAFAPLGG